MPSPSPYALIWSEVQQYYELSTRGQPAQCFRRGDEPAWQSWLDEHTAFAFVGQAGRLSSFWHCLWWPCTREGKESKQDALRLVCSR